jgi:hypothetical protein
MRCFGAQSHLELIATWPACRRNGTMAIAMLLDQYAPHPDWFAHDPNGIHGISHVTRVLVWAEHIAAWMTISGRPIDLEVVRCAAIVHDVGRVDDGRDPEHGIRSAAWVASHGALLPVHLTRHQLEAVHYCCRWHVPADGLCPEMTNELICLKDADGLDRVRIWDLDPRYLRTERARSLPQAAQQLLQASDQPAEWGSWTRVRSAAVALGLWR